MSRIRKSKTRKFRYNKKSAIKSKRKSMRKSRKKNKKSMKKSMMKGGTISMENIKAVKTIGELRYNLYNKISTFKNDSYGLYSHDDTDTRLEGLLHEIKIFKPSQPIQQPTTFRELYDYIIGVKPLLSTYPIYEIVKIVLFGLYPRLMKEHEDEMLDIIDIIVSYYISNNPSEKDKPGIQAFLRNKPIERNMKKLSEIQHFSQKNNIPLPENLTDIIQQLKTFIE